MENHIFSFPTEVTLVEGAALVEIYIDMACAQGVTIDDSTFENINEFGLSDCHLKQMEVWETENALIEMSLRSRSEEKVNPVAFDLIKASEVEGVMPNGLAENMVTENCRKCGETLEEAGELCRFCGQIPEEFEKCGTNPISIRKFIRPLGYHCKLLAAVEEMRDCILGVHKTGVNDRAHVHESDVLCGLAVHEMSPLQIRQLREKIHISQAVFAAVFNTSISIIQKWEIGDKKPSGPALKLLNLIERKGLEIVL